MGNKQSGQKGAKGSKGKKGGKKGKSSKDDAPEAPPTDIFDAEAHPTLYSKDERPVTIDDFELLTVIGKGSFGKVMQVRQRDTGTIYAMKVLKKDQIAIRDQVEHTRSEKSILALVEHPFIVNLAFAFQTPEKLYMILDYVNGGELFFWMKEDARIPEERVKLYTAEIAAALAHIHSLGYVYRDLKPENILLDKDGHIRLTDFGLSKRLDSEEQTHTFCGTPEYLAPEVLKNEGHDKGVDWWALGTLVFEMISGLPPFYSRNVRRMYEKIIEEELTFPDTMSPEAQDLISKLLERDPAKRLCAGPEDANSLMNHPFFDGLEMEALLGKKYTPSFIPPVKNELDTSCVDPTFTREEAVDSLVDPSALSAAKQTDFEGFTFTSKTTLG